MAASVVGIIAFALSAQEADAQAIPGSQAPPVTLVVGVYLPQSQHSNNASRRSYVDGIARAMTAASAGAATFSGKAFARRQDLAGFVKAGKIDLLIADGLFHAATGRGRVLAHAVSKGGAAGPAATLYGPPGATLQSLKGKQVAMADVVGGMLRFYVNAALSGEVTANGYFAGVRTTKDVSAALGAVKSNQAAAAFAPEGHPAAGGLKALVKGGAVPLAVLVDVKSALSKPVAAAALKGVQGSAGRGGGIAGWRAGSGKALGASRAALGAARVDRAMPVLAPSDVKDLRPPAIRMKVTGQLPQPTVGRTALEPTLPQE